MTAWTEERRKKQAEAIRKHKPWEKSTGPKTPKGKKRCRMNAFKHGGRSAAMEEIRVALMHQQLFMDHLFKSLAAEADLVNRTNGLYKKLL